MPGMGLLVVRSSMSRSPSDQEVAAPLPNEQLHFYLEMVIVPTAFSGIVGSPTPISLNFSLHQRW